MRSKGAIGKSVSIMLAVSMIGMGTAPTIPKAFADTANVQNTVSEDSAAINTLSQLKLLKPDGTILDQNLVSGNFQYTATVENSVQNITFLVKSTNENAVIKVNGQQTADGTSATIPLNTGDNSIVISVDDGVNPANTYTLTVTREKSNNNLLKDIQLSKGELSPKFDSATTSYNVAITNDVSAITITPVTADKTANMTINGTKVTENGILVSTPVGKTEIPIVVIAENGDVKTYKLEVTREDKQVPTPPSTSKGQGASKPGSNTSSTTHQGSLSALTFLKGISNTNRKSGSVSGGQTSMQGAGAVLAPSKATIATLTVSSGAWNKTFAKDTYTYHIAESSDVDSVTLVYTTTYSGASVTINGSASNVIELGNQSKTIMPIVVTNGSDKKTYVLVFDKVIPQTDTTTATTTSDTNSNVQSTSTDSSNNGSAVGTNSGNYPSNNTSTSWWSRLLDSIRSFFSKL